MIALGSIPTYHAGRLGTRTAVSHEEGTLDWISLEAKATRYANALKARGVGKDDMVTVSLPNGNDMIALVFGIWKLGATPNLTASKTPLKEMQSLLNVVRPRLIVCADANRAASLGGVTPDFVAGASAAPIEVEIARYWKAMPSGGSTGTPKVIVDHRPAAFDPEAEALGIPREGVVLNPGPLYHNAPFAISITALVRGCALIGMRRFEPEEALRLIDAHRVEFVNFVPTMMHRIWRLPEAARTGFDVSSLSHVWHMAAPMPPWLKRAWIEWLGANRIWELYGGTENTGATVISGPEWLKKPGSVGRPTGGARIRACDEAGNPVPDGTVGELFFLPAAGPRSAYHYLGATSRDTAEGWDSLGDFGWVDEDGYVFLADRRTDLIISGGANIYPAEVEAALSEYPDVTGAVVIGLPDEDLGARAHAIIRIGVEADPGVVLGELPQWLGTRLARYKIPRSYEITHEELRDDAGKVRRSALRNERLK
tara:strand:+ start:2478 stop:3926 length:1449 start_codon:yes stop_codon:yes gene_type:complete